MSLSSSPAQGVGGFPAQLFVIRDKKDKGYLTNDEEFLPGYALDMLDGWEIRMTESLYSYRNESMKWIIDKIDEWEEKLNEEFP